MTTSTSGFPPEPDRILVDIAKYVANHVIDSNFAYETARYCLIDPLDCGLLALSYPESTKHLGPVIPGTHVPYGMRIPGTRFELDSVQAAFDIGCTIRWTTTTHGLRQSRATLLTTLVAY